LIVLGIILLTVTALFFAVGFERLFILFHQLLFTNDLWLMDPAVDTMIRLFPGEFFQSIAFDAGMIALIRGVYAIAILFFCNVALLLATLRGKKTS
jgi:integral membrane protein (TIGR01906 family)